MTSWEERVTLPEMCFELTSSQATDVFLKGFNIPAEKVRAVKVEKQADDSCKVTWYCDFTYYGKSTIAAMTILGAYNIGRKSAEGPSTLFRHIRAFGFSKLTNSQLSDLVYRDKKSFLIEKE